MSKETDKFLEAEQNANNILNTLENLKKEAISYNSATQELDKVRQSLIKQIESIQVIAKDTHDIVKLIKEIGGPEIHKSLQSIANRIQTENETINLRFKKINILVIVTLITTIIILIGLGILIFK